MDFEESKQVEEEPEKEKSKSVEKGETPAKKSAESSPDPERRTKHSHDSPATERENKDIDNTASDEELAKIIATGEVVYLENPPKLAEREPDERDNLEFGSEYL